jgi:hypothetical protein
MPSTGRPGLQIVRDTQAEEAGDANVRQEHLAELTPGQVACREERRHRYGKPRALVYARSLENLPIGTRMLITVECSRCLCVRRNAEHVTTRRGLRQVEDWKTEYREHQGIAYLMPKGAGKLDEGDIEELKGRRYLGSGMRLTLVASDDE